MKILLISDIHANFPALSAVENHFRPYPFDAVINSGDSLVYGPFPNETLDWLETHNATSILGNTDKKILHLLAGKTFKKPSKHDKRVMYTWTASALKEIGAAYLRSLPTSILLNLAPDKGQNHDNYLSVGVFHGSPADDDEFLFPDTPIDRLRELAQLTTAGIVINGHSHTPFHRIVGNTHFINPGSIGRMFDGDPRASCAVLTLNANDIHVEHHRISYPIQEVVDGLERNNLPEIYAKMFLTGKKLN
jgi:predicted phosphodiesterase